MHCGKYGTLHLWSPHTGSPAPFLYTPTSLLPEHSVLTDVQQATGRNGHQWIRCRSGGEEFAGKRAMTEIRTESAETVSTSTISTTDSATMGLSIEHPNGLYHCLTEQSQIQYFSFFFRNSGMTLHMLLVTTHKNSFARCMQCQTLHSHLITVLLDYNHDTSFYSHSANTSC